MLGTIATVNVVDIGAGNGDIIVSLAFVVDGVSLVVVGYTNTETSLNFLGFVSR